MFASEAAPARILRSTFMRRSASTLSLSARPKEGAQYLTEAIFELETEATNLAGQVCRLAELVKPCQEVSGSAWGARLFTPPSDGCPSTCRFDRKKMARDTRD